MPDKPNYTLPTVPASEVAKWYPYAVVRTIGGDGRYVHSTHETLDGAVAERDRIAQMFGQDACRVMLVDAEG